MVHAKTHRSGDRPIESFFGYSGRDLPAEKIWLCVTKVSYVTYKSYNLNKISKMVAVVEIQENF